MLKFFKVSLTIAALYGSLFLSSCGKTDCKPASIADAGPDQVVVDAPVTLAAQSPATGKGVWSIVSGTGGNFSDVNNPTATFTGTPGTVYNLRWTISGCPASEDDVQITINACISPTPANAGPDQNTSGTSTTLAANTPVVGAGTWTIVSGAGGNFSNVNNPTTAFNGTAGTVYVLRWTISGCPPSQDDVQITFNSDPFVTSADKTSVIPGEIITLTGGNFSANYNGASQVISRKSGASDEYLYILSVTPRQIKFIMSTSGAVGTFSLVYFKKPTSAAGTEYPTAIQVTLQATMANFNAVPGVASSTVTKGNNQTVGVKNGSATLADYDIKLVSFDYATGVGQEYQVTNLVSITPGGFTGGAADALVFTVPGTIPAGQYYCKVTYKTAAPLIAGPVSFQVN